MSSAAVSVQRLSAAHDRGAFTCGVEALDRYLKRQARQDMRRSVASVFVATGQAPEQILGFYSLSMAAVLLDDLPAETMKRMPRYPSLPAVRLGRPAVALEARGRGLGTHLLMDAMARALDVDIAWTVFLVDAKDDTARRFYLPFGFRSFEDDVLRLFLARGTIEPLLR